MTILLDRETRVRPLKAMIEQPVDPGGNWRSASWMKIHLSISAHPAPVHFAAPEIETALPHGVSKGPAKRAAPPFQPALSYVSKYYAPK